MTTHDPRTAEEFSQEILQTLKEKGIILEGFTVTDRFFVTDNGVPRIFTREEVILAGS